jgi:hypothetical protein
METLVDRRQPYQTRVEEDVHTHEDRMTMTWQQRQDSGDRKAGDTSVGAGRLGQDSRGNDRLERSVDHRTAGTGQLERTVETIQLGQEIEGMKVRTWQQGQDNRDRTTGPDNYERTVGLRSETEQPRKVSLDKSVGQVTRRTRDDRTDRTWQQGQNSPTVLRNVYFQENPRFEKICLKH